jgi:diaminopimelate decarboxylase
VHVNCGSIDMIAQYGERAPGREITLRVNPGFGHGHSQKTNTGGEQSKHGVWHEDVEDALALAARHGLRVVGVHAHIGSGTDLEHLSQVCGAMERVARQVGPSLATISAGGGLPIPYRAEERYVDIEAHHALWDETRRRLATEFGHPLRLEIEPGRYLVAESGYLVAEIRAVKRSGRNTFYVLDAGFNNLQRPILYGAYHPMAVVPADGDGRGRAARDVVVGGPLCESGDIFTQDAGGFVRARTLPEARVGEHVVIACAGAYGFAMSSNYNSKPLAAEVLVDGGRARLIRARQTFEDLVRGESIPADL